MHSLKEYRVWDSEHKRWLPFGMVMTDQDGNWWFMHEPNSDDPTQKQPLLEPMDNIYFTYFTGMYDRHGNKIFQGDIITSTAHPRRRVVTWNQEMCGYNVRGTHVVDGQHRSTVEVLGNMFENPELVPNTTT